MVRAGVYCGARWNSLEDWKLYGVFRKIRGGFSIGPILFWWGS